MLLFITGTTIATLLAIKYGLVLYKTSYLPRCVCEQFGEDAGIIFTDKETSPRLVYNSINIDKKKPSMKSLVCIESIERLLKNEYYPETLFIVHKDHSGIDFTYSGKPKIIECSQKQLKYIIDNKLTELDLVYESIKNNTYSKFLTKVVYDSKEYGVLKHFNNYFVVDYITLEELSDNDYTNVITKVKFLEIAGVVGTLPKLKFITMDSYPHIMFK